MTFRYCVCSDIVLLIFNFLEIGLENVDYYIYGMDKNNLIYNTILRINIRSNSTLGYRNTGWLWRCIQWGWRFIFILKFLNLITIFKVFIGTSLLLKWRSCEFRKVSSSIKLATTSTIHKGMYLFYSVDM